MPSDTLIQPPANPVTRASTAFNSALVQPFVDSYNAVRGRMTEDEARDFAFGSIANLFGPGAVAPLKAIFAGVMAKTADKAALRLAQQMAARDMPREQIWDATGWFQGQDKKWRFEIPDDKLQVSRGRGERIGDGNPINHPELSAAYPDQRVAHYIDPSSDIARGSFELHHLNGKPLDPLILIDAPNNATARGLAGHELQHFVQNIEGFSPGTTPKEMLKDIAAIVPSPATAIVPKEVGFKRYLRTAGEVEARNIQSRMKMTPEQRRATPPWQTEDVPPEFQIIRTPDREFAEGGTVMTEPWNMNWGASQPASGTEPWKMNWGPSAGSAASLAGAQASAPLPSRGMFQSVDDAVRSLASGATFGFADEIAAGADAALGRGTYEENVARERERDKQIPAHIAIPGEIAGAVGSTLATLPITAPMAAASGAARIPALARGVGIGAGTGAVQGAGNAVEGERGTGAMVGSGIGAATGLAAPYVVGGVSRVANGIRNAVSPQANVAADLGRAIVRDETTPQALLENARRLASVRPGVATLADAGGENVRGLVERIAQTPGAGRTQVVPALTGRQQLQMNRISNDLSELTGTTRTARQAMDETMAQRAEAARPLYDNAFNFNAREVPEIVRAWDQATNTGWGQQILRSGQFRRTLQTEYGIADPANAPLMVVIDAWKKQADDLVGNATRSGNRNLARVVGDMRDRVVGTVDTHNPAYAAARDAWAGPSRYMAAINDGRDILNTRIGSEELAANIAAMSAAEQEAYRIGAVSALAGKMGSDPARMADMTKYLRSPEMRAKVAAIMPTPQARAAWADRLNFEVGSSELTGRSLGNSATARRLAERADADNVVGDLVMDAFMGHPPVSLLRRAVGAIPQRVRDTLRSRSDAVLAELLTDPAGMTGLQRALDRVTARTRGRLPITDASAVTGANAATVAGTSQMARDYLGGPTSAGQ